MVCPHEEGFLKASPVVSASPNLSLIVTHLEHCSAVRVGGHSPWAISDVPRPILGRPKAWGLKAGGADLRTLLRSE